MNLSVRIELFQKKKNRFWKKNTPKTTCSRIWEIDSMDYGKIFYKSELNN